MMKKVVALFYLCVLFNVSSGQNKNLLSGKYSREELSRLLIPQAKWTPFPKITDRNGWAKANQERLKAYQKTAEEHMNFAWPSIPATKSLLIERTGNRKDFEDLSFPKRTILIMLLFGEIYENKGRFIDPIIDGIYSICEETWWGSSAHLPKNKEYAGLMDVSQPFVDLFGAETATHLAWMDYYLGEKFDSISPQIRKRIYYEVNYRIFQPLMTKPHDWMTKNANGRPPNNWNPWICSNWLNAVLLLEKDDNKKADAVYKLLQVLDEFLNPYPQDGGCDEGPTYWGAAAAALYDNIALLNTATNGAFQYVYQDEKFKNMGKFIYRSQISEKYFLDFADADPQPTMSGNLIYRYGKDINDTDMMKLGATYPRPQNGIPGFFHIFRDFYEIFLEGEFLKAEKGLPLPENTWLPDIEVMIARDKEGISKGWFLAAKGGHNDESHNHNDIGNYIVYYDGYPLLIDIGRGSYTAKTFSNKRYEIWYNCSNYHNAPTINGVTQSPGAAFKASNAKFEQGKNLSQLTLDITKAYPDSAGINSWQRTIRLNRGKNVEIVNVYSLKKADQIIEHFMTCYPAETGKPGELIIHFKPANAPAKEFLIKYNPKLVQPVIEKIPLITMEDKGVKEKWGDNIYRINFNMISPKVKDKTLFVVEERK